jgi:DNA-binding CsgD family transcriptional regulator/PAS domain-containing protein
MSAMAREEELLDLVGRIYEAALDCSLWPDVLTRLAHAFHGQTACLFQHDVATGATSRLASVNLSPRLFADYESYYWAKDIWSPNPRRHAVGTAYASHDVIPDRVLLRSEFYNDLLKPHRLFYAIGGLPLVEDNRVFVLGMHRPKASTQYGPAQVRDLQRLMPHLARALQIQHRVEQTAAERDGLLEIADCLHHGMVVYDARGRILRVNRVGGEICRQADGLTISKEVLTAASPAETSRLGQLVYDCVHTANGNGQASGGPLLITRPSGRRSYALLVTPLRAGRKGLEERRPAAVVFLSDPDQSPETPAGALARLYGLTRAEARVVHALASGQRIEDIAEQSQRSLSTVRTQLKQVFQKTGVRRQAELVRLVIQFPIE